MRPVLVMTSPGTVGARCRSVTIVLSWISAPPQPRRLGIGMGRTGRVEIAVGGVEHGAVEILLFQQRMHRLGLGRGQELGLEAQIARAAMRHLEPFHTLLGIGQHQAAGAMQAAGLAGDPLQLVVEPDGIALQLGDIGIAVQSVEAAGGIARVEPAVSWSRSSSTTSRQPALVR